MLSVGATPAEGVPKDGAEEAAAQMFAPKEGAAAEEVAQEGAVPKEGEAAVNRALWMGSFAFKQGAICSTCSRRRGAEGG